MMERYLLLSHLFCCLVVVLCHYDKTKPCDRYEYITCPCGHSGSIVVPVKMCYTTSIYTGEEVCEPCQGQYHLDLLCQKFRNCETCISSYRKCKTCPPGTTGDFCTQDSNGLEQNNRSSQVNVLKQGLETSTIDLSMFPKNEPIPQRYQERVKRALRSGNICYIPDCMYTADVRCTIYPEKVSCHTKCIYGYTYPQGAEMDHKCSYNENQWIPYSITECQPYVSCQLSLIYGGSMSCVTNRMEKGNECDISCSAYQEKSAVPEDKYTCNTEGEWTPELPWCVEKRFGVFTVPPPDK